MGPKRVAYFSFLIILHSSLVSGNYTQNTEYNFSSSKEQNREIFQSIEKKIDQIYGKGVRIKTGPAEVLKNPDPESQVIGIVQKGKYYSLLKEGDIWCKITFKKNQDGWIERQFVTIVDTLPPPSFISDIIKRPVNYMAIILIIFLLICSVYFLRNKKNQLKKEWFPTTHNRKKIIIVSNKETHLKRPLTNTISEMEELLKETGFEIQTAKNTVTARELIFQYRPDAIAVDWRLKENIQLEIEKILSSKSTTSNIFVLFYNVPELSGIHKSKIIPNTHYLASPFTYKDLFSIITPLVITGEKKQTITKSVETSALQGNVADGGVPEVFQFVEIGKKNGGLLVEDTKPSGIVYFKDGIIIYAATKNNKGQKAVFEILDFKRGRFIFVLDKKPKAHNCSIPTLGILMEWTRINDENARNRLRKT